MLKQKTDKDRLVAILDSLLEAQSYNLAKACVFSGPEACLEIIEEYKERAIEEFVDEYQEPPQL
jgi:hypothetical protein